MKSYGIFIESMKFNQWKVELMKTDMSNPLFLCAKPYFSSDKFHGRHGNYDCSNTLMVTKRAQPKITEKIIHNYLKYLKL